VRRRHIRLLACMRSTLILDDDLFRKAKRRAAALNTTLSDVVNQAHPSAARRCQAREAGSQRCSYPCAGTGVPFRSKARVTSSRTSRRLPRAASASLRS
jgi:hypothetical protein